VTHASHAAPLKAAERRIERNTQERTWRPVSHATGRLYAAAPAIDTTTGRPASWPRPARLYADNATDINLFRDRRFCAVTPTHITENERRTRKSRIDPKLKAWGWEIVPFDPARPLSKYARHAIEEYPTANGPADYALVVAGQLLGVVEAKKVTLGPQNVLTQAERYSKGVNASPLDFHRYKVPFLYSTKH
jgi:hypothetical protein